MSDQTNNEHAPLPSADPTDPSKPTGPGLWTRLGPAALLGVAWAVLPAVLGLTLFIEYRQEAAEWLQSHDPTMVGIAIYVAAFAVTAGLGLLPTWVQAVIGGYAFGVVAGFGGALAGFVGASVIGYWVARTIARRRVEAEIDANPRAKAMRDALVGKGGWRTLTTVTLVRVPPNSPFALTNGLMASTEVPFGAYVLGTAIGMAPRTLAGVWIGSKVQDWDDVGMPAWMKYGGMAVMVVVVLVLGQIATKAAEKVTGQGGAQSGDQQGDQPEQLACGGQHASALSQPDAQGKIEESLYDILGLNRQASSSEIQSAYQALAKKHHPDQNQGDPASEARFLMIARAYNILSDAAKRADYDERLRS